MPIVWLASYPKSGNTWLRAVLTHYLRNGGERGPKGECGSHGERVSHGEPASINTLLGRPLASDRKTFDELVELDSSDLTPDEVLHYQPSFRESLAEALPPPAFVKTHDAYLRLPGGGMLFPKAATAGVIYLVRNPLDVAVSYAHHLNRSIDDTVAWMADQSACEGSVPHRLTTRLPEPLTTWSGHVSSWLDQTELPLHVARYEDLLEDSLAGFGAIVRFAGLDRDGARLARAVARAAFPRLRAEEEAFGFIDKQPTAPSFFRAGVAGSWRSALSARQVRALVDTHGTVMERLGYLREAEAFLADRSSGGAPAA